MTRNLLGRLATILSAAMIASMLTGVGTVSAAQPSWNVSFDRLPDVVAPGNDAGWLVTVTNLGPSNINDLMATITAPDNAGLGPDFELPSYVSSVTLSAGGTRECSAQNGKLVCSLGTLAAGTNAEFTVAFAVPGSQTGGFDIQVDLVAGTGDTPSDSPGKSRGDADSFSDATPVSRSSNFDGGFVVDEFFYSTNQDLGRRNIQATSLENTGELIGVTIEDGITSNANCPTSNPACTELFGEWSALNVGDGATFGTPFKVTLLILGSQVPGGTRTDDIVVVHVHDVIDPLVPATVEVIGDEPGERCDATIGVPTNAPCIIVSKVGGNFRIEAWLLHNGSIRGGI